MNKLSVLTGLLFLFCLSTVAFGQGFYIGAGIGNTFVATEYQDVEDQARELDENSTGYKFFAGWDAPAIIGIEGGYRNLGTVTISEFEFESQTKGWDVYARGRLEFLGLLQVFAKAGMFFWETENILLEQTVGETGSDFAWGLGAGANLGPLGVRLEYEVFQVEDPVNLSTIMLSATFGF